MPKLAPLGALICALLSLGGLATAAAAPKIELIDPEDVEPGMKGYGLTVFSGTAPERFAVEVIAVVPNFLLRQSIILIRCDHPITDNAGVIGGMSGSPIYLEGKLAGALAYGWRFSKEPIAGVTPIRNMLEVLERDVREPAPAPRSAALSRLLGPLAGGARYALPAPHPYFASFGDADAEQLAPARTPLALSGFVGEARQLLEEALAPYGMDPVQGGGSGSADEGPTEFEPGGALGVQLIRGDMSAAGIGTVTTVRGRDVLAFGHPMFNMGQGFLPVTAARIHTVIASLNRSNKLGSPLRELGSLVQDRQACISARTDRKAPMIPVRYNLVDARGKRTERYEIEMVSHRLLTPRFLHAALVSIIMNAASDATDVTAEVKGTLRIAGREPITLYDSGASRHGLASLASYFRPSAIVGAVLDNPFEDATVEELELDVQLRYGLEVAAIVGVYLTAEEPAPGEVVNVHVRLRMYGGHEDVITVPVRIPDTAAGERIQIEVGGGDQVTPVMATPQNLDDLIANVARFYPPRSLVVGINVPGHGVSLRGRVIEQLPASAVAALKPAAGVEQLETHRTALREVHPTRYLVSGHETITVSVADRRRNR